MSERGDGFFVAVAIAILVAIVFGLVAIFTGFNKTSGGEIAVVRNGGLFDNNKIRQVIDPASGLTWTGLWSHVHKYPAQQRFYTISANAKNSDSKEVDVVHVPTADGVQVGVEGTLYFSLNTSHDVIRDFDTKFGTRTFNGKHPYDGGDGWDNFLNQVVRPVIDNNLRESIGSTQCAELVSSCALVQNQGQTTVDANKGKQTQANLIQVQTTINNSFASDVNATLGGPFLVNVKFVLRGIALPGQVQQAVDDAQAAFGQVTQSQARVKQAKLDAEANRERQRGYADCPACAAIDQNKSIPSNIQVWAPGNGNVAIGTGR